MIKTINFDGKTLVLTRTTYTHDQSLAVAAETQSKELYAVLTVNLDFPVFDNSQFFDINLYKGKDLLELLVKEGIVEKTGLELRNGFVTYPMVTWNL